MRNALDEESEKEVYGLTGKLELIKEEILMMVDKRFVLYFDFKFRIIGWNFKG